jgi:hypothetical protein
MNITEQINQHMQSLPDQCQAEILDFVLLLEHKYQLNHKHTDSAQRAETIAASLHQLAKRNTFAAIENPVTWQQDIRQDRPLPGRK